MTAIAMNFDELEASRRSERQFRDIIEGTWQAIQVRIGDRVVFSNPAMAHMLGFVSVEELPRDDSGNDFIHPDDRALVRSRVLARAAGEDVPARYEFRMCRRDGSSFWVDCLASRILWDGAPASLAYLTDITDRKKAQDAVARSEKLFAAAFQASSDCMALTTLDEGRFVDVNAAYLRVCRQQRDEIVGHMAVEPDIWTEHDPSFRRRLVEGLRRDRVVRDLITRVTTAAGEVRKFAVSADIIRFEGQYLVLSSGRDITERERQSDELRAAKEEAERTSRAKSGFLATMSHELRTPLNSIIGFSELVLAESLGPLGNEKYRGYIGNVLESGQHLLQLINDILDLVKAEAGKLTLQEDEVDPRIAVESACRVMSHRLEKSKLTLVRRLPRNLPWLRADELKLRTVLLNLLSNAMKFTPAGGEIEVSASADPGGLAIAVADTGVGIAAEDFDKVSEPFGQVDGRLSRLHAGTGLGLPLVKAIMELHGGSLRLESTVGVGTRVTARFPPERALPR
jgi:PAS domain S-box-containing protein